MYIWKMQGANCVYAHVCGLEYTRGGLTGDKKKDRVCFTLQCAKLTPRADPE